MRVAIAGAGNVGRSIAAELVENEHDILLIDRDPHAIKAESLPAVEWLLADACELASLEGFVSGELGSVSRSPQLVRSFISS